MAYIVRDGRIEERFLASLGMAALSFALHENPQLLCYQEGIALAFLADGGGETVAGIDDGVVWQCQEFMDQRVHHFFHGAAP